MQANELHRRRAMARITSDSRHPVISVFPFLFFFFLFLCPAYNGGFFEKYTLPLDQQSRSKVVSDNIIIADAAERQQYLQYRMNQVLGIQQQLNKTDSQP